MARVVTPQPLVLMTKTQDTLPIVPVHGNIVILLGK